MGMSLVLSRASVISGGCCAKISEGEEPKEGEVDLERGGTAPLANYVNIALSLEFLIFSKNFSLKVPYRVPYLHSC